MPELNANAYVEMVKTFEKSLFKNRETKSNYKPVFLFEKKTECLLCDLISKNRHYVRERLDRDVTITVNDLECYIQSSDTFIKPFSIGYNQKGYCFYVKDNKDLGVKKKRWEN